MATAVEAAIAEIDAALGVFAPQQEGLRDFARLNLQPETAAEVIELTVAVDARIAALHVAKDALGALMGNGHPTVSITDVTERVFADLEAQQDTMAAAMGLFRAQPDAAALGLGAGEPVPKRR